jgi:uncharacterized protein
MNTPTIISAYEARTRLGELLDRVRYTKTPCLIERHGKPVAALIDIESWQQQALHEQYEQWIRQAVDALRSGYGPQKIVLFGSAASGELRDGSDIDLLVIKETDKRKLDRIDEATELLDPGIPVELHIFTPGEIRTRLKMGDPFIRQIMETGRILYEQKGEGAG